jgi:hypothetical protein
VEPLIFGDPSAARSPREAAVHHLLGRYLVEVVEEWNLCPWAQKARLRGEVRVAVAWGESCDAEIACQLARRALEAPDARVIMLVFPELVGGASALEPLRDEVALLVPEAGVAAFGPHGTADLSSPARLVPLLRRSPDPMLQLVSFSLLDELRGQPPPAELGQQARVLAGLVAPPPPSLVDGIASRNHAAVAPDRAARLLHTLEALTRDRAERYAAAGIRIAAG